VSAKQFKYTFEDFRVGMVSEQRMEGIGMFKRRSAA
jgi:hypothetical protein